MKTILSIIIPVYKVREYIVKCLESVESQSIDKDLYEVIIVNDGTPDDSMLVAAPVIERMPNARVINQVNQGLSVARNNGFDVAKGEYVWFVDSDDSLLHDALQKVMTAINCNVGVDIIATVLLCEEESTSNRALEYKANYSVKSGRDYLFCGNRQGAIQRYIIRKQFLLDNAIRFMAGVFHEDGEYSHKLLYYAKRLIVLPTPVYCYLRRAQGSIMSSRNPKANYDLVEIYYHLEKFCKLHVRKDDEWRFRASIANCLYCTIEFSRKEIFTDEFEKFYREHKTLIHNITGELLLHWKELSWRDTKKALNYYFAPLFWIKIKQRTKRLLIMLK